MSLEKVQQALIQPLLDAFPTWVESRIAWENKVFNAPKALPWFAFYFMPVDESVVTLGVQGSDEAVGLVQISINYPAGLGEGDMRKTIEELRSCYRPGPYVFGGQPVTVVSRSSNSGMIVNSFFQRAFTIRWRARITRTE